MCCVFAPCDATVSVCVLRFDTSCVRIPLFRSSDVSSLLKPGDVIRVGLNTAVVSTRPDAVTARRILLKVGCTYFPVGVTVP